MNNEGTDGYFEGLQILSGRKLFRDLQQRFNFNNGLAAPLLNDQKSFADVSKQLCDELKVTGTKTRADAVKSSGLSCHRWLGPGHACPGIIGLQMMLMSHAMRTGDGFANGHKFVHYFHGQTTNYADARCMVNGNDHAVQIADYARKFESILLKAKP